MKLLHVGLTARSEKGSDRFFVELLGMEKREPKTLPASMAEAIFKVNADLKVVNYTGNHVHFEVFIGAPEKSGSRPVAHVCLGVNNLAVFLKKCRDLKVSVLQVPRGNSQLTFVKDDDGNTFEIKERKVE
jgi:catechol 2,3-dioxygenase-like lactoylglutathione lyase family enzyme